MWLCCCNPETSPVFEYVNVGKIAADRTDIWRIKDDEFDGFTTGTIHRGLLGTYAGGVYLYATRTTSQHGEPTINTVYIYRYNSFGNLVWKRKYAEIDDWNVTAAGGYNDGAQIKQSAVDANGVLYLCHGQNGYIWDNAPITNDMADPLTATAATISAYDPSDGSILWATGGGPINAIAESAGTLYCYDGTIPGGTGTDYHFIELDTTDGSINTLGTSGNIPDNTGSSQLQRVYAVIDPGVRVWYRRNLWGTLSAPGAEQLYVMVSLDWDTYTHNDIWQYSDFSGDNQERPIGFWLDGDSDVFFNQHNVGGGVVNERAWKAYGNYVSADPTKASYSTVLGTSSTLTYRPTGHYGSEAIVGCINSTTSGSDTGTNNVWWPESGDLIWWPQASVASTRQEIINTISCQDGTSFVMSDFANRLT